MKPLKLMILCNDSDSATDAQAAGVDRIFYDMEFIGKAERQHGRNTVKSDNKLDGIPPIRAVLDKSELLVRTNPIHAYTKMEVDKSIEYGADILMLPMVIDQHDVEQYVSYVNGRAKVCVMIETASALVRLDKIINTPGVDEIFIGLNDLHISMGLTFMFELLSGGIVEYIANKCNLLNMPFGFGGIARIGEGDLPSDNILGEHVRLGSTSVILSRTFKGVVGVDSNAHPINLKDEVDKVHARLLEIDNWNKEQHIENRMAINKAVDKVVYKILTK